jgi:hypothetical protein
VRYFGKLKRELAERELNPTMLEAQKLAVVNDFEKLQENFSNISS